MLWLILSLFAALSQSTRDLLSKRCLQNLDEYAVTFSRSIFSSFCLLPLLFLIELPRLDMTFWFAVISTSGLFSLASFLYVMAIKISPLSLAIPMLAFTPFFLLITSPLMLSEFPSYFGLIGILLIVFGTYFLSVRDASQGYFAPFKALMKEKGPLIMLFVAILFSIGSNTSKIGAMHSSPFFFAIMNHVFISVFFIPFAFAKSKSMKRTGINLKDLTAAGLLDALVSLFTQSAIVLAIVPYVISVKRTNIVFSTFYGYLFFKEERIVERFTGALIMFCGVLLITLF